MPIEVYLNVDDIEQPVSDLLDKNCHPWRNTESLMAMQNNANNLAKKINQVIGDESM